MWITHIMGEDYRDEIVFPHAHIFFRRTQSCFVRKRKPGLQVSQQ